MCSISPIILKYLIAESAKLDGSTSTAVLTNSSTLKLLVEELKDIPETIDPTKAAINIDFFMSLTILSIILLKKGFLLLVYLEPFKSSFTAANIIPLASDLETPNSSATLSAS